jgi:arylsulfatase A-like enzyme
MRRKSGILAGAVAGQVAVLLLVLAIGCDEPRPDTEMRSVERDPRPDVVFVLIDTLRADHTAIEGYARDTTPGLRQVAAEGITFRRHFVNAPWTKSSVASILTGLLPPSHGAQWGDIYHPEGEVDLLPEVFDTLPELLREQGYSTQAFVANPTLTRAMGYSQGFDRYELLPGQLRDDRRAVELTRKALDSASGPVFVWCHLMAPHSYKVPPEQPIFPHRWETPIREEDRAGDVIIARYGMRSREQAMAMYDSAIVYADSLVAELMEHIRSRHPNTLVVITSDHGEEFGEHGGYLHGRTLYNEILHVPLVMWGPMLPSGESVDRLTDSVDLLPTVLSLLGLPAVPTQGTSLLAEPAAGSTSIYAEKRNSFSAGRALITPTGKLIESKPPVTTNVKPPMEGESHFEYYRDPLGDEQHDVVEEIRDDIFAAERRRMEEIWRRSRARFVETTGTEAVRGWLSQKELNQLRALGYAD